MTPGIVATVFVLVAAAELPDKTMIATLVMGSRGRPLAVWLGAAGAFLVHMAVAVAAGRAIELLPHRVVEVVVTALFLLGAVLLLVVPEWRASHRGEDKEAAPAPGAPEGARALKVAATAFGVILVGELGDLTQILTVNLVAKYHEPWAVFIGAYAGLLAASALGAFGGRALLRWVRLEWIRRAGGVALLGFAAFGIYGLVT